MKSKLTVSAQALAACVLLGAIPARATTLDIGLAQAPEIGSIELTDAELDAVSGGQPTISQSITETGGDVTIGGASRTAFSGTINFSETVSASETATTNGVEVGSGGQPTISQSITETGGDVTIGGASGTAFSGTINFSETFSASETATTNGVEVGSGGQPTISQSITETGGDVTIGGASGTAFSGTINFSETFSASETATTNGVEVGSTFSLTGTLQIGAGGTAVGNVTDNSALAFDRSGTLTFGGVISGTGSLTQLGTGTTILTGANTYSGGTMISGGTLALSGAGTIASSSGVIDNGTFDISASNAPGATITTLSGTGGVTLGANTLTLSNASAGANGTFGGAISGTGGLTLAAGTETLTGANTYTGNTTISAGTLALSGAGTIASSSGVIDNGTFDISASNAPGATITTLSGTGGVTLGANTLTLSNASAGANGTFGGAISGTGGLTLAAGTETLTGANTYTGNTTISAGTLALSGAGMIASSSGVIDNGTFDISASNAPGATITTLSGTGGVTLGANTLTLSNASAGANGTFGGAISGTGGLTLAAGTETLTGANTYTGNTTISAGTLALSGAGTIASSSGVIDNGTFDISASNAPGATITTLSGTGGVTLGANTLTLSNASAGANGTFGGAISGTGGLTLAAGTETLTGANTYTGNTTISAGTLALSGAGTIASSSGVIDNGTFDISASNAPGATITTLSGTGGVTLGANTLTLSNASAGANGTFGGAISGTGGLTLAAGTETLTGANTYTGNTTIGSGSTLVIGGAGSLGAGSYAGNITDGGTFEYSSSATQTLSGVISGAGALTQNGTGTLTLTGVNTYTGNTTIASGSTLQIGGSGSLGGGSYAGTISDSGMFEYSSSANQTLSGVISGAGTLVKDTSATSTLTLTGANTYTGLTTISAGTLQISGAGSLGSGNYAGNISNNGTFEYSSSATQRLSGVISGQGGLTKIGTGTLILTGANTYAGGTLLDVGTLGIGSNGALGAGALTMQLSTTLQFEASGLTLPNRIMLNNADSTIDTGSNTDTISGVISGPGGLAKLGSGTLIMSGANTYTGATDVQAGALDVTGSLASSVTVELGASLGGTGAIGGLVANSGATIAPGLLTPFSTLTVNGATSFAAGSIFAVAINPAGQNDKLVSTGSMTISGGMVEVDAASGTYSPSTRYTLITAHGGVSGTFSSLSTSASLASLAFLDPTLSYDADDVYLGFAVKSTPFLFASVAQTPNQVATAIALEAQPPGSSLYDAIIGQTAPGALAAFDALSGEIHASAVSAALDDTRLPREAVLDRLAESDRAPSGGGKNVKTYEFSTPTQVFAAWGQAFDSWGHIGGDGNAATISNNLAGFILGADTTLYGRYRLGIAGGYTNANLDVSACDSSGNVSATYIGLYGGASEGPLQLRGGAFYAYDHYGFSRAVLFPGFAEQEGSGYGGDSWQAFAEAGWRLPLWAGAVDPTWVEPFVGLTGVNLHSASFAETPGAAAPNGASQTYGYRLTTLGLRGEASLFTWAPLTMNGMIGWQHVFGDVTPNSVMAFASEPYVPFSIAGAPIARNALALEAGVDWRFTANVKLGVYYSGLIASNASDNAIKVKLEANF